MRRSFLVPCALLALASCSDSPAAPHTARAGSVGAPTFSAQTTTTNDVAPFAIALFVECANGGAGEVVELFGDLHSLTHVTTSAGGHVSTRTHFQPQGISGVGQVTGTKYQATGVTQETFVATGPFPVAATFVNNFRIIGAGPGNDFKIHETTHVTVNANGTVTVVRDEFRFVCG